MTFNDIFKSDFINNVSSVSLIDAVLTILLSFAVGIFIFFVYKKTFRGVMYSTGFGVTLIALTMITSVLILAVTSNVVLSLGMVGALSIVRFRTAIKEPLDIAFLFWALAAGIVLAAGLIGLAVAGSVVIGSVILIFVNYQKPTRPYIAVISCNGKEAEAKALKIIKENSLRSVIKSKTVQKGLTEMNIEVRLKDDNTEFINVLSSIAGVNSAVLVSYNGDYMG